MMLGGASVTAACDVSPDSDLLEQQQVNNGVGVRFATSLIGVRNALVHVTSSLRELAVSENDLQTLELVLAEAMNNVVKHAYSAGTEGMIMLEVTRLSEGLRCVICDHGRALPQSQPPRRNLVAPGRAISTAREGGFGWHLILELSTDLVYVRTDGANRLAFHVPFAKNPVT